MYSSKDIKRNTCVDCHADRNATFVDYTWDSRCKPCSVKFDTKNREELRKRDLAAQCEECGVKTGSASFDLCNECCDHSDVDYPCCLICGEDMTEHFACMAEFYSDLAEGR